ncbi:MAG: hypothetical protein RLP15_11325 [Cryomorphaceae bacterium]
MITIKLKVSEKIHENIRWFLNRFRSEELQVLESGSDFSMDHAELNSAYNEVVSGNAKTISLDEFNKRLTEKIAKHGS